MAQAALQDNLGPFTEEGSPFLSPRRVAEVLGVTQAELARLVGLTRNTLASAARTRRTDEALSPLVRILVIAAEMTGTEQRAALWFKHQPIPGWAGRTAFDLVSEGRADAVMEYLEAVRSGVYA